MCNQGFLNNVFELNNDDVHIENNNTLNTINKTKTTMNENSGDLEALNLINIRNMNRPILAHLNINSLRNKFDALKLLIKDKIDILVVTETKLDETFPMTQFHIEGFKSPIRLDRNAYGGGIIVYIRENIPSKLLQKLTFESDSEGIFFELHLRKTKFLFFASYNLQRARISAYLSNVEIILSKFINDYDNIVMMGDFNWDMNKLEHNPILDFSVKHIL